DLRPFALIALRRDPSDGPVRADRQDLVDLSWIAGGDGELLGKPGGERDADLGRVADAAGVVVGIGRGHPVRADRWICTRRWMPPAARSTRRSSSAREKGSPSAVPWSSTREPEPVITTLKSTPARASSE